MVSLLYQFGYFSVCHCSRVCLVCALFTSIGISYSRSVAQLNVLNDCGVLNHGMSVAY